MGTMSVSKIVGLVQDCGWTRANRKLLKSVIGESEVAKLTTAFEELCPLSTYSMASRTTIPEMSDRLWKVTLGKNHNPLFRLHSDGENIWLKLGIEVKEINVDPPDLKFTNQEINLENIKSTIMRLKDAIIKSLSKKQPHARAELEGSKIMEKLFSPEFTIKPQLNEEGYYLTTIMDRRSGRPVIAYIKELYENNPSAPNKKTWELFIRHKNGSYEKLGQTIYRIDEAKKRLTCGWMDSYSGQGDYAGIGVRLHEWRIAQARKLGFSKIGIVALDEAFPFHYKCGFRVPRNICEQCTNSELEAFIYTLKEQTGISAEELEKLLVKTRTPDGKVVLTGRSVEDILIESFCRNGRAVSYSGETVMELSGEGLAKWYQRMDSQPILPN